MVILETRKLLTRSHVGRAHEEAPTGSGRNTQMKRLTWKSMGFAGVLAVCSGCASLMMHVTDVDDAHAGLHLKKGDTAAVPAPDVAGVIEDKAEATEFAGKL